MSSASVAEEGLSSRWFAGRDVRPKKHLPNLWLGRWLVLLCLLLAGQVNAQSSVVRIDPVVERIDLSTSTWLLEDSVGDLTLAQVQSEANASRFKPGSPRIGYSPSAYWLRFSLLNPMQTSVLWWLDSGNRKMQEIELFVPDDHGVYQRQSASSTRPYIDRPLPTADFVFPVTLPPNRSVDIYLRVRSTGYQSVQITPQIWQPNSYQEWSSGQKTQWLVYLGMAVALGLFNLLLYFSIRDTNYLFYVLSLISMVWAICSAGRGFGPTYEFFWPNSPLWEQASWIASGIAVAYLTFSFAFRFIALRSHMPRLHAFMQLCIGYVCITSAVPVMFTLLQLPHSVWLMQRMTILSSLGAAVLVVGATVGVLQGAFSGRRSARFLMVAWLPTIVAGLRFYVELAVGHPVDPTAQVWASAFELIFMSLALADRFNQEKREKERAQRALVEGLQQSERELEGKVVQRTAEVKAQAAQIAEWNSTLEQRVQEQVGQIHRLGRLKRFFSPQLAEVIVAGGEEALATHRREISVLFIDLRGFTAFTDRAEPEEVIDMLRSFHAAMGRIVMDQGGTLERFAGDSVMVFFNDPVPMERHAERAVYTALVMQDAFLELSAGWKKKGITLGLGCGIAQGYATLGEIGFEGRWDYAAIGTVTNLAARLCAEAAAGQVLVDQKVMNMVEGLVLATPIGPLELKGFIQPVPAFSMASLKHPA